MITNVYKSLNLGTILCGLFLVGCSSKDGEDTSDTSSESTEVVEETETTEETEKPTSAVETGDKAVTARGSTETGAVE